MNKSICPICHLKFSITTKGKIRKHGYKYRKIIKEWKTLYGVIQENHYIKIKQACFGSGIVAENIIDGEQ